jgi:hypothetical protein
MYEYVILLIKLFFKLYPYIYYAMSLYQMFGYFNFARIIYETITSSYYKVFGSKKTKKEQEIDEIYEIIENTTPFAGNVDDTNYRKFYERNKNLDEHWFSV